MSFSEKPHEIEEVGRPSCGQKSVSPVQIRAEAKTCMGSVWGTLLTGAGRLRGAQAVVNNARSHRSRICLIGLLLVLLYLAF